MQQRGVQVVHVAVEVDRAEAKLIGGADNVPGLDPPPGHPHGEGINMMIAPGGFTIFSPRGAAEFTAPDD